MVTVTVTADRYWVPSTQSQQDVEEDCLDHIPLRTLTVNSRSPILLHALDLPPWPMSRQVSSPRLCLGFSLFAAGVYAISLFPWSSATEIMFGRETNRMDFRPLVEELENGEEYGAAIALIDYVDKHPELPHHEEIVEMRSRILEKKNKWTRKVREVLQGAWTGEGDSAFAMMGALATDLVAVGDLRDLIRELAFEDDPDYFIVALSSIGLTSSAMTFLPEPVTTATGTALQVAVTTLKLLRKGGNLTEKFAKELEAVLKAARISKDYSRAKEIFSNLIRLQMKCQEGVLPLVMRKVHSAEDLRVVSALFERAPNIGTVIFRFGGDQSMKTARLATKLNLDEKKLGEALLFGVDQLYERLRRTPETERNMVYRSIQNSRASAIGVLTLAALFLVLGSKLIGYELIVGRRPDA